MYNILSELDKNPNLMEVISQMELKTPYGEQILFQILTKQNYVKTITGKNMNINDLSSEELQNMLKKQGRNATGKRKKLLKIAKPYITNVNSNQYEITKKCEKFISDNFWITIYEVAFYLCDYNDYYKYIDTH